jgi:hypothetical protein
MSSIVLSAGVILSSFAATERPNQALQPTSSRGMKRLKDEVKAKLALARQPFDLDRG